jgi:hypothetical protein
MEKPKTSASVRGSLIRSLMLFCSYVLLLSIALTVMRLDFSKSKFTGGDLLQMLPLSTWIFLILLPVGILVINKVVDSRSRWLFPFALALVFAVIFPLIQYPSIQHWDYFAHSSTSTYIADYGHILPNSGYFEYPGAFILLAALSEVLGLNLLIANLLLFSFLNLTIALLLLVVGNSLMGAERSWLVPTAYFSFSFMHYTNFLHFSPALVGFALYILFVHLSLKAVNVRESRARFAIWLIVMTALTTIHPFTSFVCIITLSCVYLLGTKIRSPLRLPHAGDRPSLTLPFALLGVVLFLSWNIFFASEIFRFATSSLISLIRSFSVPGLVEHIEYNPIRGSLSPVLSGVLSLYRYGIYAVFGGLSILCCILYWRRAEVKLLTLLALGIVLETILVYLTPATFGVSRLILYASVPVSILTCYSIRNIGTSRFSKIIKGLEILLPFLVAGTFLVSNLYVCTYTQFVHQDEVSACRFVVAKSSVPISLVIDESFIIRFYASPALEILTIDERTPPDMVQEIQKGSNNLQYLPRQLYYFNLSFVEGNNSLIYSNGLARIYSRDR